MEEDMIFHNTSERRVELNKLKAEFIQYLKFQDVILRKKAKANWLKDGDKNIAFFHEIIKGRRKRLNIQNIKDDNGIWREGEQDIATATIDRF